MELTPDERRRIYEEEKARLEAVTLTPEQKRRIYEEEKARIDATEGDPAGEPEEAPRRNPWIGATIAVCIFFVIVAIISSNSHKQEFRWVGSPVAAGADSSTLAGCEDLIQRGYSGHVISEIQYSPELTEVLVGPMFYTWEFKAKEGLCRAIGYVSKSRGGHEDLILRDSRTNNEVGSCVTGMLTLK